MGEIMDVNELSLNHLLHDNKGLDVHTQFAIINYMVHGIEERRQVQVRIGLDIFDNAPAERIQGQIEQVFAEANPAARLALRERKLNLLRAAGNDPRAHHRVHQAAGRQVPNLAPQHRPFPAHEPVRRQRPRL
ncbi:MAG: hypothetical protein S4CHLAM102_08320 [Chlamydiia bacterium]|nr:hypothetical protein [Chlamydiia bacterium]